MHMYCEDTAYTCKTTTSLFYSATYLFIFSNLTNFKYYIIVLLVSKSAPKSSPVGMTTSVVNCGRTVMQGHYSSLVNIVKGLANELL